MADEFVRERVRIRILARNSVKAVELEQVTTVEIVDSLGVAFDGGDRVLMISRHG